MAAKLIFKTDNGKVFNISLDPGLCFAMCLDVAKVQLTHIDEGRPSKIPNEGELTPGKWAIVQSAYMINRSSKVDSGTVEREIIEAQGLEVSDEVNPTDIDSDFEEVVDSVVSRNGVNLFGINGSGGAHMLLWIRDDENGIYLYLDPNEGLYSFDDADEAFDFINDDLEENYDDLDDWYLVYTVSLS